MAFALFVRSDTTIASSSVACVAASLTGAGGGGQYFNFAYADNRLAFNVGIGPLDISLRGKGIVFSCSDNNLVGSIPRSIIVSASAC